MPTVSSSSSSSSTSTQPDKLLNTLNAIHEDAQDHRSAYEDQWEKDLRLVEGDHWENQPPKGVDFITHNLTARAVEALTAGIIASRPRTDIFPTETDGKELFFIPKDKAPQLLVELIQNNVGIPFGLTMGHLTGDYPLLHDQAQAMNPLIPIDDMERVSDSTIADCYKRIHGQMWEDGEWDATIALGVQENIMYGTKAGLAEWDSKRNRAIQTMTNPKAVWVDPQMVGGDIATAQYAEFAELLDVDFAVYKYGDQIGEATIRKWADQGGDFVSGADLHLPAYYTESLRTRKVLVLKTFWLRGQKTMRYKLKDGFERGTDILQARMIADHVIDSGPCKYGDIPLYWMVNIPRYDAYGKSEPSLLSDIQKAINRFLTSLVEHGKHWANPQQLISTSVLEAMGDAANQLHSYAGRIIPVPDDVLANAGGANALNMFAYPPQMNQAYVNFWLILIDQFQNLANQANVTRGESDPNAISGRAINALQAAASQVMTYRAVWIERALSQMTRLVCRMIADFMPENVFGLYTDKYSPTMLRIMRARGRDIDYNAVIELVGGRGQNRIAEKQQTMAMFQLGLLSKQTTMAKMGIEDPETERFRIAQEQEMQVKRALAIQTAANPTQLQSL